MKLTNEMKDAIINAVIADTPREYSSDSRDKDATAICVSKMPTDIRKIWDNKAVRHWIATEYAEGFNYLPTGGAKIEELIAVRERYRASEKAIKALREHVRNVVYQFSTDVQMRTAIPELDAYIPKPPEKTNQLPVVHGLMEELSKAGFPKDKS
jgi:hypothetical protein